MTLGVYGFDFATTKLDTKRGPIDPAEEYFRGAIDASVARETIQNSLDVATGPGPVIVEFELQRVQTSEIPGMGEVREAIERSLAEWKGNQGGDKLAGALDAIAARTVWVLRIGDYGTTGLTGSESVAEGNSPLSALTRGIGVSSSDQHRGGSFGIGSAVGTMASRINTVLYYSLPHDTAETVFAGHTRQASHQDANGVWHQPDGFFRNLQLDDDFEYLRNWTPMVPFAPRSAPGTDTFILGYRRAEADGGLAGIRLEALRSFMVAIDRGELVVRGITEASRWELNADNLQQVLEGDETLREELLPFHRALHDAGPTVIEHREFGSAKLYVYEDDALPKPLHTWTMRQKHMKVDLFKFQIRVPYAAILIVDDDEGNRLLRALEPPEHNAWQPEREPSYGKKLIKHLKDSVRAGLRDRLAVQASATTKVKGLARFLPNTGAFDDAATGEGRPVTGAPTDRESATLTGLEGRLDDVEPQMSPVRVSVRQPGTRSDVGAGAEVGRERGGDRKRSSNEQGIPGGAEAGDGAARIPANAVRTRAWRVGRTHHVVIRALREIKGDLRLAVLTDTGSAIDGYPLRIEAALGGDGRAYDTAGSTIKGLSLTEGQTERLEVTFTNTERIRLGVN